MFKGIIGIDLGLLMDEMCTTLEENVEEISFLFVESIS